MIRVVFNEIPEIGRVILPVDSFDNKGRRSPRRYNGQGEGREYN